MTSPDLASGTDRVHAIAERIPADIYINLQGDEPLLRPEHVTALLRPFSQSAVAGTESRNRPPEAVDVTTLCVPCSPENIANPNAVKVVRTHSGRALYFSRAAIPFHRDPDRTAPPDRWKHLGLYAYRRAALMRFPTLAPSALEASERLEQLRWLENGFSIYVEPVDLDTIGVDTEADLLAVEPLLQRLARPT